MPWPRRVIEAMPSVTAGMMAGESPSNGSSRRSSSGSSASARAMESILRSPPLISGPFRATYVPQHREDRVGALDTGRGRTPRRPRPRRDLDVLGHGEVREDAAVLGSEADALPRDLVGGPAVDAGALEGDGPRARAEIAHDGPEQGGLARAVPAHQAHDLVGADVERKPPEDVAGLDVHVEVADREHQGFRRRPTTMSTTRASAWISAGVASARTLPWWSAMIRWE